MTTHQPNQAEAQSIDQVDLIQAPDLPVEPTPPNEESVDVELDGRIVSAGGVDNIFSSETTLPDHAAAALRAAAQKARTTAVDGTDHINIGRGAVTELGRLLNPTASVPFVYKANDTSLEFKCVAGLRGFLIDDSPQKPFYQTAHGNRIERMLRSASVVQVPGIETFVAWAHWFKIAQNGRLALMLLQNKLPLMDYDLTPDGQQIHYRSDNSFTIRIINEIAHTLQERVDTGSAAPMPNFTKVIRGSRAPQMSRRG